ncbi:MAG: hypothetical protein DMG22_08695 [Acidobacteria bacterium]|nr:MAG: hypothetical protein DMG22_08695 [Acidobacteriota bacterium]
MAIKKAASGSTNGNSDMTPVVAATLAGVIYQAKLMNRQSKLNIPEQEVVSEVVSLWQAVMHELGREG